jgi:hypothetical protein
MTVTSLPVSSLKTLILLPPYLTYACQHLSYKKVRYLLQFRVVLEALVNDRDELAGEQPEDPDPPVLGHGGEHVAPRREAQVHRLRLLLRELVQVRLNLRLETAGGQK